MHRQRYFLFLLFGAILIAAPALAQQEISYDDQVRLYHPTASGELGLFTAITGETLKQGDWSFGIVVNTYDYLTASPLDSMRIPSARSPRDMDVEDTRLSLSLGYGITDRWEIVASVPYIVVDQNSGDLSGFLTGYPYAGAFDANGWGNLHIGTKFGLLDPATHDSRLALSLFAELPTGDEETGVVSGDTDYGIGLHWTRDKWTLGAQYRLVGDRDAKDNPLGFAVDLSNEIRLDLGLNMPLKRWATTNWINELNATLYTSDSDPIKSPDDMVYFVSGLRHFFGDSGWAVDMALRANLTQWSDSGGSCPIGGLFGLSFTPMHLTPPPPPPPPPPAPKPEPKPVAPPPPPVAPPSQPVELYTDEIHFEPGSARVTNIAKAILDDVALRMKNEPASTAIVIGYTDDRENTGPNADLDRRRAEAVRDYLVSRHGIDPARIQIEAKGTMDAIGDNTTKEGRLKNRRVVIRLVIP